LTSFSRISFSPVSFDVGQQNDNSGGGSHGRHKQSRWRAWIAGWARDFRTFFHIKQRPPEPEDVPIPVAQPPKIFHILPEPPTMETKLETLNDKWEKPLSVVASIVDKTELSRSGARSAGVQLPKTPIYPLILNPLTAPLIQTKVTLPRIIKQPYIEPYRVGEGSHIESQLIEFKKPRNRSKTASTINTLMILLEIESKL